MNQEQTIEAFLEALQAFPFTIQDLDDRVASRKQIQAYLDDPRSSAKVDEDQCHPTEYLFEASLVHVAKYRNDFELVNRAEELLNACNGGSDNVIDGMTAIIQYHDLLPILADLIREGKVTLDSDASVVQEIMIWLCSCETQAEREQSPMFDWACKELVRLATVAAIDERDPVCVDAAILLKTISMGAADQDCLDGLQWLARLLPGSPTQRSFLGVPDCERGRITTLYEHSIGFAVTESRARGYRWLAQSGYRFPGPETKMLLQDAINREDQATVSAIMEQWRADPWFDLYDLYDLDVSKSKDDWTKIILRPSRVLRMCSKIHNNPQDTIRDIIKNGDPEELATILHQYTTTEYQRLPCGTDHRGCYCLGRDRAAVHVGPITIHDSAKTVLNEIWKRPSLEMRAEFLRELQEYMIEHDLPVQYRYSNGVIMITKSVSLTPWQASLYRLDWIAQGQQLLQTTIGDTPIYCAPLDLSTPITLEMAETECHRNFKRPKSARSAIVN